MGQSLWSRVQTLISGKQTHLPVHLRDRVHVLSQSSTDRVDAELSSFVDYATVYQVYVWVKRAVTVITEALAPLPLQVLDGEGKAVTGHPLAELFGYVNDELTPADLWGLWVVHMLVGGESFLQLVPDGRGNPAEVWPRRPDLVGIEPDKERGIYYPTVAQYVYDPTRGGYDAEELEIAPEEMCHIKFPNPLNPYRGLNPARAVRSAIVIDLFAHAWKKRFFQKGAHPDYALVAPQGLTPTERDGYRDKLRQEHQGYENWFEPIILEEGVTDIKIFSWPPKDLEWMQTQEMNRDEVGGVYGVPDEVMGFGRDTYENYEKAYRWFMRLTVMGLARRRDSTLTSFFQKRRAMLKPGERIATDTSGVAILQEDKGPKVDQAEKLWKLGVPFNTLDEQLGLGIGPVPGGDTGYVSFSLVPVGGTTATNGITAEAVTTNRAETKQAEPVPEYGTPRHKALWKERTARYMPHERRMAAKLLEDLEKQQAEVMAVLREGKAAAIAAKGKQNPPGYATSVDEFFDKEHWDAWFALMYEVFYTDVVRASGQAELARFELDAPFDMGDPRVQRAIVAMRIKFADDINATTQERMIEVLRAILQEADQEGGWSVQRVQEEIEKRISDVFEVRKSAYERERIARTEMHKASEIGNHEGARQAGKLAGLEMRKAWLTALDGRERDTHREAHLRYHDNPIALDEMFEVGSGRCLSPGNTGVVEEDVNCRCAALYYAPEE